jgi:hypothetical protein
MSQQSHRHHYIPEFLIKNFANEYGQVHVYDKLTERIAKAQRSPKSVFFENDRNTIRSHGKELDHLEQLYGMLDNLFAADLTSVLTTRSFTPENIVSIILLAANLKWRVPARDEEFNILKETKIPELQMRITVLDENRQHLQGAVEYLQTTEIFKQIQRVTLGMLPLMQDDETKLAMHNDSFIYTQSSQLPPALISDCPIIEKPNADYTKLENFIFPLSSNETFIYKSNSGKDIKSSDFFRQKDLAVFHAATRYVACQSRDQLENIADQYQALKQTNQHGRSQDLIFDLIA